MKIVAFWHLDGDFNTRDNLSVDNLITPDGDCHKWSLLPFCDEIQGSMHSFKMLLILTTVRDE